MRKVHIDKVEPWSKLGKTIFSSDGRILLQAGVRLKRSYIEKLKCHNIAELYVEDDISEGIAVRDVVCDETRQEAKSIIKDVLKTYVLSNSINAEHAMSAVDKIIDDILSHKDILVNLTDIKSIDDYTFEHSINVCILSVVTGIELGMSMPRLRELGLGALLHDIGKIKIPEQILKKPSVLTPDEFDEIKRHTVYGYEALKKNGNISVSSAMVSFAHHERLNGSGYPLQVKGESIHQFAKIAAVADVYDALMSDRVYRSKLHPYAAYEYVTSMANHYFDQEVLESFVKHIAVYPVSSGVVLNTGERGIVAKANKNMPTRPIVRIIYDADGKKLSNYYELDLAKQLNVVIAGVCEI